MYLQSHWQGKVVRIEDEKDGLVNLQGRVEFVEQAAREATHYIFTCLTQRDKVAPK